MRLPEDLERTQDIEKKKNASQSAGRLCSLCGKTIHRTNDICPMDSPILVIADNGGFRKLDENGVLMPADQWRSWARDEKNREKVYRHADLPPIFKVVPGPVLQRVSQAAGGDTTLPKAVSTHSDLLTFYDAVSARGRDLLARKNKDYSRGDDPFENFREFGAIGILTRMRDKLSRLKTWVQSGGDMRIADESVDDTAIDLHNYCVILLGWLRDVRSGAWAKPLTVGDVALIETEKIYVVHDIGSNRYFMLDEDGSPSVVLKNKDDSVYDGKPIRDDVIVLAEWDMCSGAPPHGIQFSHGNKPSKAPY